MSLSRIKVGFWGDICKHLYFYIDSCDKIEIHFRKGKSIGSDTQKGEQWFKKHAFFVQFEGFFTFKLKKMFFPMKWQFMSMHGVTM